MKRIKYPISIITIFLIMVGAVVVYYANNIPSGTSYEGTLVVGSDSDTLGSFKILPSPSWGSREVDSLGNKFRPMDGSATISFQPPFVLKNSKVSFSLVSDNVFLYPQNLERSIESYADWKYNWDFTRSIPTEFISQNYVFDQCTYFDGNSISYYPNSSNLFESGPFSVYLKWRPDDSSDFQQLVGHFNWEVYQSKNFVIFQIGRLENSDDTSFYSVRAPISTDFFGQTHTLIAQYVPAETEGYIELFLDNEFVARKNIGSAKIDVNYSEANLSLGWSPHNYQKNPRFKGCVYNLAFTEETILFPSKQVSYIANESSAKVKSTGKGKLFSVNVLVEKQ